MIFSKKLYTQITKNNSNFFFNNKEKFYSSSLYQECKSSLDPDNLIAQDKVLGLIIFILTLFNAKEYIEQYADLSEVPDPLEHYIKHGFQEGRRPCSQESLTKFTHETIRIPSIKPLKISSSSDTSIAILHHSKGNFFFQEIAEYILSGFKSLKYDVRIIDENLLHADKSSQLFIIGPHEFFLLEKNISLYTELQKKYQQIHIFITEQPQTVHFWKQARYLFTNVKIASLSHLDAIFLNNFGIAAQFLPLGFHEASSLNLPQNLDNTNPEVFISNEVKSFTSTEHNFLSRPIDISFIGNLTPRREEKLAQLSCTISNYSQFIFSPLWNKPHQASSIHSLNSKDALGILQRSKILLNIHQGPLNYFEWHRICLRGFITGAVIVTEEIIPIHYFTNGLHYIQCPLSKMGNVLNELLSTPKGLEKLQQISKSASEQFKTIKLTEQLSLYMEGSNE